MRDLPGRFVQRRSEGVRAWLDREMADDLIEAGLLAPWRHTRPRPEGPGTGRGPRGVVTTPGGVRVWVKQCLRGGVPAAFNRELYFSLGRFRRELRDGWRAVDAGCPVIASMGYVFQPAAVGHRAWQLTPFVEGAKDLARWLGGEEAPPGGAEGLFEAGLAAVGKMHLGGLYHRDLNLGNLLAQPGEGERPWRVWIVDLDRARWFGGPVPARWRCRALDRLERSWVKLLGTEGPLPPGRREALYGRHR